MSIYQKTPQSQVDNYLKEQIEKREKSIIRTLKYVGETCINEARSNGDYMDQTGNLRSSIGYAVLNNGVVENKSDFKQVKNGSTGKSDGHSFLGQLIGKNSSGIVLIIVAGMNYAAYVETKRNVITSAELLAKDLVPQLLKQLGFTVR